jgi:hypothetical protein
LSRLADPADYLITALGTNDVTSQRRPDQFLRDYALLADTLRRRTGAIGLVVTGLPPLRILPAAFPSAALVSVPLRNSVRPGDGLPETVEFNSHPHASSRES